MRISKTETSCRIDLYDYEVPEFADVIWQGLLFMQQELEITEPPKERRKLLKKRIEDYTKIHFKLLENG